MIVGRNVIRAVVLVMFIVALAGCSSPIDGSPRTSGTDISETTTQTMEAVTPVAWDPCGKIPAESLRQAGVDPATEHKLDRHQLHLDNDSADCTWSGEHYFVTLYSFPDVDMQEVRRKPGTHDFTAVTVGGRKALRFRQHADDSTDGCDLAVPVQRGGVVIVSLYKRLTVTSPQPPCDLLRRAATALVPILPR